MSIEERRNVPRPPNLGTIAARYELVRLIGSGGTADVYEVFDRNTKRPRALKLWHGGAPDETTLRRFQREIAVAGRIRSDNIVQVIDSGTDGDKLFMVMEMLSGEALDSYLHKSGPFPFSQAHAFLDKVGRTLERAHAERIVHRDLKPSNIFVTVDENDTLRPKILDFGLAALVLDADASMTTTLVGTPRYVAPEQFTRGERISERTDLYALGLIAYEVLVGQPYRTGETIHEILRDVASSLRPANDTTARARAAGIELPAAFDGWMQRAIARNPDERWPAASVMIRELGLALGIDLPEDRESYAAATSSYGFGSSPTSPTPAGGAPDTAPSVGSRPSRGAFPPYLPGGMRAPTGSMGSRPPPPEGIDGPPAGLLGSGDITGTAAPGAEPPSFVPIGKLENKGSSTIAGAYERSLGVTRDLEPYAEPGTTDTFAKPLDTLRPIFSPMLPRRMRGEVDLVVGFLGKVFSRFEVARENVIALRKEIEGSDSFFYATFMLELEGNELHTRTFVDYATPLAASLPTIPKNGHAVMLAIMAAEECGGGVLDVIHDFRTRYSASIVPIPLAEIRRAARYGEEHALLTGSLKKYHPRHDAFDTRVKNSTHLFGLDPTVNAVAEALGSNRSLIAVSGAPGGGKSSVLERLQYDLQKKRFTIVNCVEILDRTAAGLASAAAHAIASDLPAVDSETALDRLKRAIDSRLKQPDNSDVLVLDDADWAVAAAVDGKADFSALRELWTTLAQTLSPRFSIIVTGIDCHALGASSWSGWNNPVSKKVKDISLAPVRQKDMERMVRELGKESRARFEGPALACILEESAGNMNAARRICSKALSLANDGANDPFDVVSIDRDLIQAGIKNLVASPDLFDLRALGTDADSIDRAVLRAVNDAQPQGMVALMNASALAGRDPKAIDSSIARLSHTGLIEIQRGRFVVRMPLMKKWLRKQVASGFDPNKPPKSWRLAATGIALSIAIVSAAIYYGQPTQIVSTTKGPCSFLVNAPGSIAREEPFDIELVRDGIPDDADPKSCEVLVTTKPGAFVRFEGAAPEARIPMGVRFDMHTSFPVHLKTVATRVPTEATVTFGSNAETRDLHFGRDWLSVIPNDMKKVLAIAGLVPALLGLFLDYREGILKLIQRLLGGVAGKSAS